MLYKYTGIKYIPSCIENGVYASQLDNINDPYEGKGIRYPEQYRVVCLTASSLQMLMWAYYGNHKGCCVAFDVNYATPVEYIKEFQMHEDMSTKEVIESLYQKGNEWKHEKEFRIVFHESKANDPSWKRIDENIFLVAPVKKIVFGYLAEMDEKYVEMLEYIKEYNQNNEPIEVTKCRLKNEKYQLAEDKQFDIDAELKRLVTFQNKETMKKSNSTQNNNFQGIVTGVEAFGKAIEKIHK